MTIEINENRTLEDIQSDFGDMFPYLKIVFFSKPHTVSGGTGKKHILDHSLALKQVRKNLNAGSIQIEEYMKVIDLENIFWNQFGLPVQVFRKSGSSWLETTATDLWTLEKQNRMGMDITNFHTRMLGKDKPEEFDNDRTK
jgi:hypothetical protein